MEKNKRFYIYKNVRDSYLMEYKCFRIESVTSSEHKSMNLNKITRQLLGNCYVRPGVQY